jgi:DNA (cytosine-5)-methyltransferase 1
MAATDGIRAIDLFCGAGGSSCGARSAGAEVIAGFDLSPNATATFQRNFPEATVFTGDLRSMHPKRLRAELGPIDLLLASPECTNHSVAKGAVPRDEASKQLAFEVIRFAKAFEPRWVVVENVMAIAA